jgi:hypothetical protein
MKITKAKEKKLTGLMTNPEADGINNADKAKQNVMKVSSSNENAWAIKYKTE